MFRHIAVTLALLAASCATAPQRSTTVELNILAINDFHGNLEPPSGGVTVLDAAGASVRAPGGGAPRLATLVAQRRALASNVIMAAAGDLIGASPMLSSLFHDEPTVEAMNMMGLSLSAVGNHEFDEGAAELLRMQNGGCHPRDGCRGPTPFAGARFQYLAANTIVDATAQTLLPPSVVHEFDGVRVGFIGLTLEGTSQILAPGAAEGLTFLDEVETINTEAARLRAQGIEAIVVLLHEGGSRVAGVGDCPGLSGAVVGIMEGLDPSIDVVVSGHTNGIYICRMSGILLTSASQYGALLTDIALTIDRRTGDVIASSAHNFVVADTLAEDAALADHIAAYRALAAPMMSRPVGTLAVALTRTPTPSGESPMGLVVADSMLASAASALGHPADVAFMNRGGVRASLDHPGAVTLSDIFSVTPFGNDLVTLEMTGAEIEVVLAQQFRADRNSILQVSEGSSFAWRSAPDGGTVMPGSVRIAGAPLDRARTYLIVTNSFLASGGEGFTGFTVGRARTVIGSDLDALEAYFAAHSPVDAPAMPRALVQ